MVHRELVALMGERNESLNLAKIWKCPVLFFIVNNGYGMGTSVEAGSSEPDLWKKGASFRIYGERVDGTDVLAVRDVVRRLRARAEAEQERGLDCVEDLAAPGVFRWDLSGGDAVLILGVFMFQIREQFDSLDIRHLEKLKED